MTLTAPIQSTLRKARRNDAKRPPAPQSPSSAGAPRELPLAGQVALITGSARGLGLCYAKRLLAAGASVSVLARRPEAVAAARDALDPSGARALGVVADARDPAAIRAAVDETLARFGRLDLAVANAGMLGPVGRTWEVDAGAWWEVMELHVGGALHLAHAVLPAMQAQGSGRLVLMSIQAGFLRWPTASAYSVSKAAVNKLVENLAVEARSIGVQVFAFHPGLVDEGMTELSFVGDFEEGSAAERLHSWVRDQFARGHFVPAARGADLLVQLAAGELDERSGAYIDASAVEEALVLHGVA